MKERKNQDPFYGESGSALSFVVILILSMTLLGVASMTLARTQLTLSRFGRQTSNSYHLARSGAEKIVDTMNKEIAMELPRLMEMANEEVHKKLLAEGKAQDGVTYQYDSDFYSGKYIGREYKNEYKIKLKEGIYDYIVTNYVVGTNANSRYEAFSDTNKNRPILITAKIYSNDSTKNKKPPVDITSMIKKLATANDIGTNPDAKEAFVVEVIAQAKKNANESLTKSRVVGTISLEELQEEDQLIEEYQWATTDGERMVYPEALQAGVISFGDFVIQGENKVTISEGDVQVKGTQRKSGGIIVSDGGTLEITNGSAFVVSNIQTINSSGNEGKKSHITIAKDAIANTIAINDNYDEKPLSEKQPNDRPWDNLSKGDTINITRNAYVDDDIRIDRYIEDGKINIGGSAFGISDGDPDGTVVGSLALVDPNKSSGIFSLGTNSVISMGRAFIAGQAFIDFGDGMGYHRLHESAGEPFQEVYHLEKYQEQHGDDDSYMTDPEFEDIINTDTIKIEDRNGGNPAAFAPAYISENGGTSGISSKVTSGYGFITSQIEARKLFYAGYGVGTGEPKSAWRETLAVQSDLSEDILGTTLNWGDLVLNPLAFYTGVNPYQKQYLPTDINSSDYTINFEEYKGLQGYMLAKRGVFYKRPEENLSLPNKYRPVERAFNDLIKVSAFSSNHEWSYNDPIHVISGSETINTSNFSEIPTAIVCTNPDAIITLTGTLDFNGIIITPGKVEITDNMTINGSIIAGNEHQGGPSREAIQKGDHAGIQILADDVKINYHEDMLLQIRFMEKSLQRKLYDSLKITDYEAVIKVPNSTTQEQDKIDAIMGRKANRIIQLSPKSVISSEQGGLKFVMKSLRKL